MGKTKAWTTLIAQMGPVAKVANQFETLNRFFVLETLRNYGFFEYIKEPKSYGDIKCHFNFKEMDYTDDLFEILRTDKKKIIVYANSDVDTYQMNPKVVLPKLQDLLSINGFEKIYHASRIPQQFAKAIPNRLTGNEKSKDFIEELDTPGPSLFDYDEALTHKLYTALRNSIFAYVNTKKLKGKKILDVGCGSGRETAELWIQFKGEVDLTGVDPVRGFVETADSQFQTILEETIHNMAKNKVLPDLNEENKPKFAAMRAEELNFPDESFDAVFLQQILHWTSDPRQAILEIGRVLKPGGMFFGCQGTLPLRTPYMNIMIRAHEKVNGFFTLDNLKLWLEEAGLEKYKRTTPAGIFKCYKKK